MKKRIIILSGILAVAGVFAYALAQASSAEVAAHALGLYELSQGVWGVGLATALLVVGGAIGVTSCSPMPALSGVFAAALINWGPVILLHFLGVPVPAAPEAGKPKQAEVPKVSTASSATPKQ